MLTKKGLTASFIVGMMITLIAFIVISGILLRFTSQVSEKEAESLCKTSIDLRAATAFRADWRVVGIDVIRSEIKGVPPLCKTIDKKIDGTREQIKRDVANAMVTCWWMFGEGRYDELLDTGHLGLLPTIFGYENKNQCFNCYTLLIQEYEGSPITSTEMQEFMIKNTYPRANVSYLDYIQSAHGPGRVVFTAPAILPHEAYAVSMMPKNKEDSPFWKGVGQVVIGGAVVIGVVAGVTCIVLTGGSCAAILGAATAGSGAATSGAALTVAAASGAVAGGGVSGTVAIVGASSYLTYSGYKNVVADLYAERDVSSIYVGFLKPAQEECGSGDLAGE